MKGLKKTRRIQIIALAFVALALSTGLIGYAMRDGINFFRTPTQIAESPPGPGEVFRIGGLVVMGSLQRGQGETVRFERSSQGVWTAIDADGNRFAGSGGANVIFDKPDLNPGNRRLEFDWTRETGDQNWEDIAVGGDADFNDVNVTTSWTSDGASWSNARRTPAAASAPRTITHSCAGATLLLPRPPGEGGVGFT